MISSMVIGDRKGYAGIVGNAMGHMSRNISFARLVRNDVPLNPTIDTSRIFKILLLQKLRQAVETNSGLVDCCMIIVRHFPS